MFGLEIAVGQSAEIETQTVALRRKGQSGHDRHLLPVSTADGEDGSLALGSQGASHQRGRRTKRGSESLGRAEGS